MHWYHWLAVAIVLAAAGISFAAVGELIRTFGYDNRHRLHVLDSTPRKKPHEGRE